MIPCTTVVSTVHSMRWRGGLLVLQLQFVSTISKVRRFFLPFAVDVCGALQSDVFVQRLADSIASRTGSTLSLSVSFVRQRLSCAFLRAVAMQLVPLLVDHVHPTLFNDPILHHSVALGRHLVI